jgi:hypothetical protein
MSSYPKLQGTVAVQPEAPARSDWKPASLLTDERLHTACEKQSKQRADRASD